MYYTYFNIRWTGGIFKLRYVCFDMNVPKIREGNIHRVAGKYWFYLRWRSLSRREWVMPVFKMRAC